MTDYSVLQGKTAAYITLGCKLNFAETATSARRLARLGVRTAAKDEPADICIVNTCSVTDVADRKCRQTIHRMVRQHPGALVVVTGCYAQLQRAALSSMPGVGLVVGNDDKGQMVERIALAIQARADHAAADNDATAHAEHADTPPAKTGHSPSRRLPSAPFVAACSRGNRTRYFLKVQDGCSYFCTYCTIPFARGTSRNPTIASLVEQARQAAAEGGREIVLTGVNIGDFGRTTGETFLDLVRALDAVGDIDRYRISSIEPDLLTDELIRFCAESRAFMPHFHIPLQSGSDEVLRLMHRRYDTQLFAAKVELIRRLMPDAFIGVDVMAGMRGETQQLFEQSCNFIAGLDISRLHVFPYSERPGTAALAITPVVSPADKKQRCSRLLKLSDEKCHNFYTRHTGATAEVLIEHAVRGRLMHGFTRNYLRVELPADTVARDNTLVHVRLGNFNAAHTALTATIVNDEHEARLPIANT